MSTFSAPPPSGGSNVTKGEFGRAGRLTGGHDTQPIPGNVIDEHSTEQPPAAHPSRDAMGAPAARPQIPVVRGDGSMTPIAPPAAR